MKIDLAVRLEQGDCGGTYAEAVIILCCVLSGIAADVWPGRNKDRKRFVELLCRYSEEPLNAQVVSVPLLVENVRSGGNTGLAEKLQRDLLPQSDTLVITGADVDKTIPEMRQGYPEVEEETLKRNTYACLLYEEIRSGFVHEYMPGKRSDSWAMTASRRNSDISYINRMDRNEPDKVNRLIYFRISWLVSLIRSIVANLSVANEIPVLPTYDTWWLEQ